MIKHATAGTFLMRHDRDRGWLTGMIWHPIFDHWMQPGGHVEADENAHQAALREVAEETGILDARLVDPREQLPSAESKTSRHMPPPWWIVEHPIEADNHLSEPHIHIDHKYVAVTSRVEPTRPPAHPFSWLPVDGLDGEPMFDDIRAHLAIVDKMLRQESPSS